MLMKENAGAVLSLFHSVFAGWDCTPETRQTGHGGSKGYGLVTFTQGWGESLLEINGAYFQTTVPSTSAFGSCCHIYLSVD